MFLRVYPILVRPFATTTDVGLYVVGESTGFGEPFGPQISYPKIISFMFNDSLGGVPISIVNLSQSGSKTRRQYERLRRQLYLHPPSKNSLLFIYLGINDWTNGPPQKVSFCDRVCRWSRVFEQLYSLTSSGHRSANFSYENELGRIIELGQSFGLRVFISNLCGNFSDFPPKDNSIFSNEQVSLLLNRARVLENSGALQEAEKVYNQMENIRGIAYDHVFFRHGRVLAKMLRYNEARESFFKMADSGSNLRPSRYQNTVINKLAVRYGAEYVDAVRAFTDAASHGLIGYNLFIDAHHPNLAGYIVLSNAFAARIAISYQVPINRPIISEQDVVHHFSFTRDDWFKVYISRAQWLLAEASEDSDRAASIKRAQYYVATAEDIWRASNYDEKNRLDLYLTKLMVAVISKDSAEVIKWLNRGEFLTKSKSVLNGKTDFFKVWIKNCLMLVDVPQEVIKDIAATIDASLVDVPQEVIKDIAATIDASAAI
ncbi:MAG: hypothetical protein NTU66_05520 [Elusimicrobia bacterium]|nr:hypothetical protein [Elusimicrobiota bacterium]